MAMTTPCFVDPGTAETTKGAVHGAVLTLAVLCGVYNGAAWRARRQRHLAVNVAVYGLLTAFEVFQIARHTQAAPR